MALVEDGALLGSTQLDMGNSRWVSLIPDMGEKYQKVLKMGFCDSWPYTFLVFKLSMDVEGELL